MSQLFRVTSPARTCTKTYASYRSFKKYLAKDFNNRCGYTDCSHFWFGGMSTFHIDHFLPHSKHPHLKTIYSNLVYSCSFVNILKSNDEGDYLDPCDNDFNDHFKRMADGRIVPVNTSKYGVYMFNKLKLGLKRYAIIWKLDELLSKEEKLKELITTVTNPDLKMELQVLHSDLSFYITDYIRDLKGEQ